MKALDFGIGVVVAAVGYYGLSLASAFWIGQMGPQDHVWSIVLGVAVSIGLGAIVGWRVGAALVACGLMLALIVIAYVIGSDAYDWAAPFPADVVTLFLHGARSPLVAGPTALVGAAGIGRVVSNRRRVGRSSRRTEPLI